MNTNASKQIHAQLAVLADLDRLLYRALLKCDPDKKEISSLFDDQMAVWSTVRALLSRITGDDHVLIEQFDRFLFERHKQIMCYMAGIRPQA